MVSIVVETLHAISLKVNLSMFVSWLDDIKYSKMVYAEYVSIPFLRSII